MRWLSRTLHALLALGTLLVVAAAAVLWLAGSEPGTRWLAARLSARASGVLALGRVDGTLLGGLDLTDVRVTLPRDRVEIAALHLEWDPAAALAGSLAFRAVRASPVSYTRLAEAPGAAGGEVPLVPFVVRVDDAVLAGLTIDTGGEVLELGESRGAARLFGRRLTLSRLSSSTQGVALAGNGTITLGDSIGLAADVAWSGMLGDRTAAGRVMLEGEWPVLHVRHDLSAPVAVTAEGELTIAETPRFDLTLSWADLAVPDLPQLASPSGRMALVGTLDAYRFTGDGTLDLDGRAADFTTSGTGRRFALAVDALTLAARLADGSAGALGGSGAVDLAARTADLDGRASDFDPAWLVPEWSGRLSGTAAVHARLDPQPEARFEGAKLEGELFGRPVKLASPAVRSLPPDHWELAGARLESGPNVVVLDGALDVGGALALEADVTLADLRTLVPTVRGAASGKLKLDGTFAAPAASGRIEARDLQAAGVAVERIAIEGRAGLARDAPLSIDVDAGRVARGLIVADSVGAAARGTTGAFRVTAGARAAQWLAQLAATGGLDDANVWRGSLERLEFDELKLGRWRLAEPARAALGVHAAALDTACLLHDSGARWCAALDLEGKPEDRLVVSAQNFQLASLQPLLPAQLQVDGVYQLSASFLDITSSPRGAVALTGGATHARVAFGAEQAFAAELKELRASATLTDGRLDLAANVAGGDAGDASLSARIDDLRAADSSIGGAVHLQWRDLAFLVLLSPELGQVAGALALDLDIGGTLRSPEVQGRGQWSEGRIGVPGWGLTVERIAANATSRDGRALTFDATGHVGDGELKLTGETELDPGAGWPTRLKLTGDGVRAVQLPDAEIYASPDLDVAAELPNVRVTGTVAVPRAAIKLSELPAQAIAPSPDAVVHGAARSAEMRPLQIAADVELVLGDDVRYTGLNLETKVSGSLKLQSEPSRSTTANGTLTLTGTYNAYGQELNLERGRLLFSGPLDDPGLDVRAVRAIDETRVGIELVGSLKAPRTRVFSTPAMSEGDALSYLLLGRPLTGTGTQETATLQTAALSMGLQQALPVVQRIGQSLGLDELSVQSTATDAGALMAGKYLSPKVYIRYSYGLFNRIGGLLLRFKVNERLSIETRSGDQKSMDLLYTVEKE